MATLFVHAVLPLVAQKALRWPPKLERRVAIAAVVCSCLPDIDMATFAFEVRPTQLIGHGGITHSLFAALLIALGAAAIAFRMLRPGSRPWWQVLAFLFAVTASHGLLDALTASDMGIALFAPFENGRHLFPWKLLPSCELGVDEYLGFWGLLTIANEFLYVVAPVAFAASFFRARTEEPPRALARREQLVAAGWVAMVLCARLLGPEYFTAVRPRILAPMGTVQAGDPADIPHDDLPGGKLVTRFDELRGSGLFDAWLAPANPTWSSSFFPAWFGAEGGRWMDGSLTLIGRTLFGFAAPGEGEARQWMADAEKGDPAAKRRMFDLAPTEKLDIALGHLTFPATNQALAKTHNGHPRYWNGRCNGVATASLNELEPFRVVDVIGVDGGHILFHPNDTKALLAIAYYLPKELQTIGEVCDEVSFDPGAACSMSPAVLAIALLNRLGIARRSILIDALPSIAKQYYAVAGARIAIVRGPYPKDDTPADAALAPRIAALVDVTMDLTLSSTTLPYARANVLDPASADGSRYQRVGLVAVPVHYQATLALDGASEIIGGRWTGDPANGPDDILIPSGGPRLTEHDTLSVSDEISWPFIRALAQASVQDGPEMPVLDMRAH